MKIYPESVLEVLEGTDAPAALPTSGAVTTCFEEYREFAQSELRWVSRTVKQIKQSDDEDVLDRLYRRGHVVARLADVLGVPRVPQLLGVLDLVLDLGREMGGFERHSMGYLVELLIETAVKLLEELGAKGQSSLQISDVLGECRTYLAGPLAEKNAPPEPAREALAPVVTEAVFGESAGDEPMGPVAGDAPAPTAQAPPAVVDDSPEVLDIPVDKVTFIADFCEEARESLGSVGRKLIELETAAAPGGIVNDLFRNVHTVKGGARLLKISKIEAVSHAMESILDQVRKGARKVTPETIDVLMDCTRGLETLVEEVTTGGPLATRIQPLITALDAIARGVAVTAGSTGPTAAVAEPAAPKLTAGLPEAATAAAAKEGAKGRVMGGESIRVPTEKLDEVLNTASEIFIGRIRLQSELASLGVAVQQFKKALHQMAGLDANTIATRLAEANKTVCDELEHLLSRGAGHVPQDRLVAMIGRFHGELQAELDAQQVSNSEEIALNVLSIEEIRKRFQKNIERLEQLSSRLQTGAMSFRMVPISQLFDRFPAQVREVARQVGKIVRLEVSGGDTELDKLLINKLGDPLIHIMRNAVDHGIEDAEERVASGKAPVGRITLRAYYHGSHAVIEVTDDGRGINQKRVLEKAISVQLVTPERAASMTSAEILELVFEPGFSTAGKVSALSGRGVGMDVVKTAVNQVQGSVAMESELGVGTSIRIKLPLTLAVVGILLVEERSNQFAFPILNVEEILVVDRKQIQQVSGATVYNHRGRTMPVTTLSNLLDFPRGAVAEQLVPLVVLTDGDKKIGVIVDTVLGKQDVLIKNLGSLVRHVPFMMGCTILSDSRLVLILNAFEVVNKAAKKMVATDLTAVSSGPATRKDHVVLVVDDSAIQRKNLSAIISQAGYRVEAVENGFEGLKFVRRRRYSAFCVDVVMPLMDGFEFVERLRRTPGHAEAPVLFITARTTRSDRDRAAGFGVVEYFNKPVDAERLVESIDRHCLAPAHNDHDEAAGESARA